MGGMEKQRDDRVHFRAEAALLAVTVVWGGTFLAVQVAMALSGPLFFVGLRFAVAAAIGIAIAGKSLRHVTRGEVAAGVAIGASICGGYTLQSEGLRHVLSSESAFITALYVPLVPILQWAILRRPPSLATWAGAMLAFAGVVLIGADGGGIGEFGRGELITLVSAAVFAVEILVVGYFAPKVDARRVTAIQLCVASALCFALMPVFGETPPAHLPWALLAVAGGLGLASALIQLTMTWAQKFVSPARATIIYASEPVWAALLGFAAGERLGALAWAGGGLVIAGVLASEIRRRGDRRE
jgi:drug/metabolite transporter (DMT)-like permease